MSSETDGSAGEASLERPDIASLNKFAREHYVGASTRAQEHALASARWSSIHRSFSVLAAVLSAVAGGSLIADSGATGTTLAAVLALVAAVLSATDAALGAAATLDDHKKAADRFTTLASGIALFYRVKLVDGSDHDVQGERYQEILAERDAAASASPITPRWARAAARKRSRK